MAEKYPDSVVFLRGDANASVTPRKGNKRDDLLAYFMDENKLYNVPTNHNTYHHFTNNGQSDSSIDVIMHSKFTPGVLSILAHVINMSLRALYRLV